MRKYTYALAAGAAALSLGCNLGDKTVDPTDAPTAEQLTGAQLSPGGLATLAIGVLAADRFVYAGTGSAYPIIANIYTRDLIRLDPSEPRYVNETLGGAPDPGSFAGGGGFAGPYQAVRAANTLLQALDRPLPDAFDDAELSAGKGFARTFKAIAYYRVLELRDTIGIPLQKDDPNDLTPAPIICKTSALRYIAALLDSANVELAAGGANLPFTVPSGLSGFGRNYGSVANFIQFNRGWKGKVDLYRALDHQAPNAVPYATVIAELTQGLGGRGPGAVPAASFPNGLYHVFVPAGTEAIANSYADTRLGLHPSVEAGLQAGDTRSSKFEARGSLTVQGITITRRFKGTAPGSTNQARPLAVLRDEELVLLRAQAYFENNDVVNGLLDLNSVRTSYGLPALLATDVPNLEARRTALLYEKRYSLFGEGVQRLVDLRAYSRLNRANFPQVIVPTEVFNTALPIPKAEADARQNNLTPVCS